MAIQPNDIDKVKDIILRMSPAERRLFVEWMAAQAEVERWKPLERGGPDDR